MLITLKEVRHELLMSMLGSNPSDTDNYIECWCQQSSNPFCFPLLKVITDRPKGHHV